MSNWNGFDFFIFLILVINTILGMSRGATKEIISMMCLSAALIFTIEFTVPLAQFLNSSSIAHNVVDNQFIQNFMNAIGAGALTDNMLSQLMYSISLLICFVGVFSVCEAGLSVTGFTEVFSFPYATLNRKVGGALGFTRGYIISLIVLCVLTLHIYSGNNFVTGSFFAQMFQAGTQKLDSFISGQQVSNYQELYKNQPYNEKNLYQNLKASPSGITR